MSLEGVRARLDAFSPGDFDPAFLRAFIDDDDSPVFEEPDIAFLSYARSDIEWLLDRLERVEAALSDTITTAERFCVLLNTMPGTTCSYDPSPARAALDELG